MARGAAKGKGSVRAAAAPVGAARPAAPPTPVAVLAGLAAVAMAVPLCVLGDATGPSDDPKAWALPILVAATAVAWTAWGRRRASAPPADGLTRALRWAVLALLGWAVVTTATSIAPGQSLLGVFGRGMGLLPASAAVAVFFLARSACRGPAATRAIIDAALVGSAPVCLIALAQAAGWDPFPASWDPAVVELTVRSTFGQHIFLGSYLVVLIPLAAARLDSALLSARSSPRREASSIYTLALGAIWIAGAIALVVFSAGWTPAWWLLVPWGVAGAVGWTWARHLDDESAGTWTTVALVAALLAAQVAVVVLSRARGAFLAMLVGLAVTGFGILARRRATKTLAAGAALLAGVVLLILLLNVPQSPLAPLRDVGLLSRLSRLTDVRYGSPVWFRLRVWSGIASGWGRQLKGEEIVPDTSPLIRSAIGYGLETELIAIGRLLDRQLGVLRARGEGWEGQYLVDRAHNALLDQLVTGGLVGAGLWLAAVTLALAVMLRRARGAARGEDASMSLGLLGAGLAHLAEGQVGIVTPMPLALFWLIAGVASAPRRDVDPPDDPSPTTGGRARRAALPIAAALAAALVVWLETSWLLASTAYAEGARAHIAGRTAEALADFQRARRLAPWLSLPAEGVGYTALRMAAREPTASGRLAVLREGESALAAARRHSPASAASWALSAQVAFAEARAGDRAKLPESLAAFDRAARLRPQDPALLAQWGWALLDAGNPAAARKVAERAIEMSARRPDWLAWAVLARSARELGDDGAARRAADEAARAAPAEARHLLAEFLFGIR